MQKNNIKNTKMVGHLFLKKLGKTKLRPGGMAATNFLLNHIDFTKNLNILEIACNNGVNLSKLSKQYENCVFTGIDLDANAIKEANNKKQTLDLKNCTFIKANAVKLPFENESFDIVINEAMLTMLPIETKQKVLSEVFRVLKSGGFYLTHDIALLKDNDNVANLLSQAINMRVNPLLKSKWLEIFKNTGYELIAIKQDFLTLMNPFGMIKDEGFFKTLKIIKNGLKPENKKQFLNMRKTFKLINKDLNYIALVHKKI